MSKNIPYQTDKIADYFSQNRIKWSQFYESEKKIIKGLKLRPDDQVLDIGCGCGGLGLALKEQFSIHNYTGVEINKLAAVSARQLNPMAIILHGDILSPKINESLRKSYDFVFSLSCIDWNIEFAKMLSVIWDRVKPGGQMVATFRLSTEEGCNDMTKSYQFINYEGLMEGEKAPYVVLNINSLLRQLMKFEPAEIKAFGYWGIPSSTAVTPYERLCFAAISIQKRMQGQLGDVQLTLDLPSEVLDLIDIK